eukprot:4416710-Pyramimonas_sp.AAC.1
MAPTATVADLDMQKKLKNFSSACITESGAMGSKLLGECTPPVAAWRTHNAHPRARDRTWQDAELVIPHPM